MQVKSAFLPKLAGFVNWPSNSFNSAAAPIVIGVLGVNPFSPDFSSSLATTTVRGRSLELRTFNSLSAATNCHLLFVASSESGRSREIITQFRALPVLVIADFSHFAEQGGTMNYIIIEEKVRFEINRAAAEAAGLAIDSRLLSVSRLVNETKSDVSKKGEGKK